MGWGLVRKRNLIFFDTPASIPSLNGPQFPLGGIPILPPSHRVQPQFTENTGELCFSGGGGGTGHQRLFCWNTSHCPGSAQDGHLTSETLSWDSESPAEARNGARLACLHSAHASRNWIPGVDPTAPSGSLIFEDGWGWHPQFQQWDSGLGTPQRLRKQRKRMTGRLTPRLNSGRGWHWRFAVYRVTMIPFLLPGWAGLQTTEYTARELVRRRLYSEKKSS